MCTLLIKLGLLNFRNLHRDLMRQILFSKGGTSKENLKKISYLTLTLISPKPSLLKQNRQMNQQSREIRRQLMFTFLKFVFSEKLVLLKVNSKNTSTR